MHLLLSKYWFDLIRQDGQEGTSVFHDFLVSFSSSSRSIAQVYKRKRVQVLSIISKVSIG